VAETLYALCYPRLAEGDRQFINQFRQLHDHPYRDVVVPHFTMVFGCTDIPLADFREHVGRVARAQQRIAFSCRYAMVSNDDSNDYYYVFLVPDEGYSEISKLHDRLYSGALAPHLRLDIPYVPHIGIATIADAQRIKALCDELNSKGIAIEGTLEGITVCSYDGAKITDLETVAFRGP
jgi:hypothetical protein